MAESTSLHDQTTSLREILPCRSREVYHFGWINFWGAGQLSYRKNGDTLVEFDYTANGELQSKTAGSQSPTTYDYDAMGNLRSVTLEGDTTIEYLIDGQNRRVGKKVNGQFKQGFIYQDQLNPVAELDENGDVEAVFIYGAKANVPSYMIKNGTKYRIVSDPLGSVKMVVNNSNGKVVQRIKYDAFGRVILNTNSGFQPFGFAGGLYDHQTGLVRFGARDYDATLGRWTSKDPILFSGRSPNLYGYVLNDPLNRTDKFGLAFTIEVGVEGTITGNVFGLGPPLGGGEGNAGVFVTIPESFGEFTCAANLGVFAGAGEADGLQGSAGLFIGGFAGGEGVITGTSTNYQAEIPGTPLGGTLVYNQQGELVGGTVDPSSLLGIPVGRGGGISRTKVQTGAASIQDLADYFRN